MRVADLERLYDCSYWANRKVFDVIAQVAGNFDFLIYCMG